MRGQKIAAAFADILKAASLKFTILDARETLMGECMRRADHEMLFQFGARPIATLAKVRELTHRDLQPLCPLRSSQRARQERRAGGAPVNTIKLGRGRIKGAT